MGPRELTWAVLWAGFALGACGGAAQTTPAPAPTPAPADDRVPEGAVRLRDGTARNDLIPRALLFGNLERTRVRISPDGRFVSWLAPKDGVISVFVAPVGAIDRAKPVTAEVSGPIDHYDWAFDGKHLLYRQNFHIFAVDVGDGSIQDLTPYEGVRAEIVGLSPRMPGVVAIRMNDDLYRVGLASGARSLLFRNDQQLARIDLDHNLAMRIGEKPQPDGSVTWLRYDKKRKKQRWTKLLTVGPEDASTTRVIGFDRKGTAAFIADSRSGNTTAIYRLDLRTRKKKLIFEDLQVDATISTELGSPLVHPTDFTIQAVQIEWDVPRWVSLDERVRRDLELLPQIADGRLTIVSRTLDDRIWIVGYESDQRAPRYYRWNRTTQTSAPLFSAQPALDEQPLVRMQPTVIRARDGLDLISYLGLPRDADADGDGAIDEPLPMVLLVHGGPWQRQHWGYDPAFQLLANRGYAVLSVNFRGSTGFGKRFVDAGDRQWGKQMQDDLLDAVDWAIAKGIAAKDKICILGESYGGYATLVGLAMTPEVFACGVDAVGPSNLVTLLESTPSYGKRIGDPATEEGKQALLAVSPLTHADAITKPLLIGQGGQDPSVKKDESDQIVAALQAKHVPVSYVVFPDEGHVFERPENDLAFWAVTEAFLSVQLGGWYQPITEAELKASSIAIEAGRSWLPGLPASRKVSAR